MATAGACIICLDTSPPPIQSGCACRGDSGLAHIDCLVKKAGSQQAHRGNKVWWECQTCKQQFTGAMRTGLAEAWRSRVAGLATESCEKLAAESNLAVSLLGQGKSVEAERVLRALHELGMRVHGAEHPNTLTNASNLALSLSSQGKYAHSEFIIREVLAVQKRVVGAEHPDTLTIVGTLAESLSRQGKYAEAEVFQREVLGVQKRVLGAEHPHTLASGNNLAASLSNQGKNAEAEAIQREVLGVQIRVLGAEHPHTLGSASNLAASLSNQGKYVEAEQLLQSTLASCQRILGPSHPTTLHIARSLEIVLGHVRSSPPTEPTTPAAITTARPLPAGTRVLVQRLVAKPEHNGRRACVLSFDARTGRYAVALGDAKKLSLKAECVSPVGCAAAGCASEEASSVCGRCAAGYCSCECQVADCQVAGRGLEGAQADLTM